MNPLLASGLRKINSFVPSLSSGLSVLAYHLVDGGTDTVIDISSSVFERQLDCLASNATFVDLRAGVDAAEQGETPTPQVALTFDDAFENFVDVVWPIIERRKLPVTLFVPVDFVRGGPSPLTGGEHLRPCTWKQLAELSQTGLVSIGSHTMSHRNMRRLSAEDVRYECAQSRMVLEEQLGTQVETFCYPQSKWSAAVADEVRKHYSVGVIAGGRVVSEPHFDRAAIPRFPITKFSSEDFETRFRRRWWLDEVAKDFVRQYR